MLGQDDIPTSRSSRIMKGATYTDKVLKKAIEILNTDKVLSVSIKKRQQ